MYDCIIIGGGPAGMTAAIYTARKKLKTLLVAKEAGGQMVWSSDVENYTGFSFITGADLTLKFEEHLKSIPEDLEVKYGEEVVELEKNITSFAVHTKSGEVYYGRSVIIASGKNPKKLGIPGEDKFFGHGVATCATCDAPLYKGKTVAVVGGGNSAMDAILALSKVAAKVHVININDDLSGDEILKAKIREALNVDVYKTTKVLSIDGDKNVESVTIQQLGRPPEQISVQGVFVEIGYEPSNSFDKLTDKNEQGEIIVDENLQTNIPGIFAAGDINSAWGEQIVIAAGEGAKAAIAVGDYLNRQK
jgi:NADH-dependent peroxiredoxin subunit F